MSEKIIVIDSDTQHLKKVREEIRALLPESGLSEKDREDVLVALGEACTNAMRHSYEGRTGHEIRITFQDQPDRVILKIRDFGKKIDLSKLAPPQLPPVKPHGLGIYFMQTMMDELQYNTNHAEGNELIMSKYKKKGAGK